MYKKEKILFPRIFILLHGFRKRYKNGRMDLGRINILRLNKARGIKTSWWCFWMILTGRHTVNMDEKRFKQELRGDNNV